MYHIEMVVFEKYCYIGKNVNPKWDYSIFIPFYYPIKSQLLLMKLPVNPLTVCAEYIRDFIFYWHIGYHVLNILKIKYVASISKIWKKFTFILSNLNNFHHLKLWIASARHNFKWVKIQIE